MKNILILFLLTIFLSSCIDDTNENKLIEQYLGKNMKIIVVDSCEYILFESQISSLTHKGNCKFCKIRNKK